MSIASDLFRTITVKIHDISQQLPYIVVNQADDNGKIIRFVPLDHGQIVTGFTGARLYYPPRSDSEFGDYVTGVEADGAWDFTIPVGVLSVGRVGCNLAFIDGDGETYSRNVVFLVEPAVSGVFDPQDGQQTRLDKIVGTVQTVADTAIDSVNKTASDAVGSIGKAEESINESVTNARGSADAAANSANQASASASAAQTSERNAANSAASVSGSVTQAENAARSASQSATQAAGSASAAGGSAQAAADSASKAGESATAAKASETIAASSASAAKISETNAAASATAAQQAVDGFGLQAGTTTTGEPGTDAAVSIAKQGTKYVADFTIPRGPQGLQGLKGDPGDLTTVSHDDTLDGNGTNSSPLKVIKTPGVTLYKGWQDPSETGTNLNNGDLWLKTPRYLTDIDPANQTEGASTAEYYTYAQGAADNSPSVLVRTGQIITDMLEYSNGAWRSLIWRVDSSLTPGKETTQGAAARTLSDTELLTRIEALEAEVKSLKRS